MPVIGDVIPSRWAYEALAVTSFADNAYEQPFFDLHREKYETQYYYLGFLDVLQSQLETIKAEGDRGETPDARHMEVIKTNLPVVAHYCGVDTEPADYSYATLKPYMAQLEDKLAKRSNEATLKADAKMSALIREIGKDAVLDLKHRNYNLKLEDIVVGIGNAGNGDANTIYSRIVDNHIVPQTGIIFLTPRSTVGRAPFYSSEKILGTTHIPTLWFNMGVMLLMAVTTTLLLLFHNKIKTVFFFLITKFLKQ